MTQIEKIEQAAERYACKYSDSKYGYNKVSEAFRAGANWQKEKMMKGAVEGEVYFSFDLLKNRLLVDIPSKYKEGDKVKVIIIKED